MLWRLEDRYGPLRPDQRVGAAIVAAFVVAGALVGLVVATGRPVPIALTLGFIAGVALLNVLPLVIWLVLVGVLFVSGPVFMFVPELDRVGWLFSLLGFFLAGAAMLYPAVSRNRFRVPLPPFVTMAVVLFAFGLLSIAYSGGSLGEGVRAAKRYFQYFGLLFILAVVPYPSRSIRRWWGFVLVLALIQLPFAVYQRLVLVPMRESMPRVYPMDIIVGTMEGSMRGGGSFGVMTMLVVFAIAFTVAAYREGMLPMRWLIPLVLALAAPLAIGAATVVVVLLPIAFLAVYADLITRRTWRFVGGVLVATPVLALLGWLYLSMQADAAREPFDVRIAALIAYNFGEQGYYGSGLNRTTVYPYWVQHHNLSDPVRLVFGHGLGASFGGINEANPGHMDAAHSGMFIGLTAASSVLWDLGIVGLLLYLGVMASAVRCVSKLVHVASAGLDRAMCRGLYALALMLLVMLFHSNAPISVPTQQVLFALTLGTIAWRWRSERSPRRREAAFAARQAR